MPKPSLHAPTADDDLDGLEGISRRGQLDEVGEDLDERFDSIAAVDVQTSHWTLPPKAAEPTWS